jgi:1-deoxy-D-xylulose-5-phosphate reductoisomerase
MKRQQIALLGSTGSIGRQTLETADLLGLAVPALAAGHASPLLEEQARKYKPSLVAVFHEQDARDMAVRLADTTTKVVAGMPGLIEAAALPEADTVVTAVGGQAPCAGE